MTAPAEKRPTHKSPPRRSKAAGTRTSADRSETDPSSVLERELTGEIGIQAGSALSAGARLRVRGPDVFVQGGVPEKEKVSITLDKPLVDEIRTHFRGRALSTSINELLHAAMAQERLGELVDAMEEEAGATSAEAYERVLAQWFADS